MSWANAMYHLLSSSQSSTSSGRGYFLVLPSNISCMVKQLLKFLRGTRTVLTIYTEGTSVKQEQLEVVHLYLLYRYCI